MCSGVGVSRVRSREDNRINVLSWWKGGSELDQGKRDRRSVGSWHITWLSTKKERLLYITVNILCSAHHSYMLFTAFKNELMHCLIETLCEQDGGDTRKNDPNEGVSRLLVLH